MPMKIEVKPTTRLDSHRLHTRAPVSQPDRAAMNRQKTKAPTSGRRTPIHCSRPSLPVRGVFIAATAGPA